MFAEPIEGPLPIKKKQQKNMHTVDYHELFQPYSIRGYRGEMC